MNAAFASIVENLRGVEIVLEPTPDAFKGDRIQTANGREFTVGEFVSRYFPTTYTVKKGPIYSLHEKSNEIDCVLLAPNHPVLITPNREVIIAEGVHAAIELKPDIVNLVEFKRSLEQIKSVKRLERTVGRITIPRLGVPQVAHNKYFDKIPTFLFAFKSKPVKDTIETLIGLREAGKYEFEDFPDYIITMDNGIIAYTPFAKEFMFKEVLNHVFGNYPDHVFMAFHFDRVNTLAMFVNILCSVLPPETLVSDFILKKYLSDFPPDLRFQVWGLNTETLKLEELKQKSL